MIFNPGSGGGGGLKIIAYASKVAATGAVTLPQAAKFVLLNAVNNSDNTLISTSLLTAGIKTDDAELSDDGRTLSLKAYYPNHMMAYMAFA